MPRGQYAHNTKYHFDPDKVQSAMHEAGIQQGEDLHPNSKSGPAAKIVDKLGMDATDRNLRRGLDRFIQREGLSNDEGDYDAEAQDQED